MKKLFITILCFCGTLSFAQNGFFLQPEIGAGFSNSIIQQVPYESHTNQRSVFSYQGQLDLGYKAGKWRFITGVGYMQTGVRVLNGNSGIFRGGFVLSNNLQESFIQAPENITDYNPHIIVPVKIGYEVHRFNSKLSFTPLIGAEFAYNMPRTFISNYASFSAQKETETQQQFDLWCNQKGVIGLVHLNFEYKLNNRYAITAGPSLHYMFTSELNFRDQNDYAVLMNLGLKWNFKKNKQAK